MSDSSADFYGDLTGQFKTWLKDQGIRHAVIVSRSDLMAGLVPEARISPTEQRTRLQNFVGQFSGFPADALNKDLGRLSLQVFRNKPVSFGYDTDGDGKNDTVVIVAYDRDTTKADIASSISGVPADQLQGLPGTTSDWHAFVMAHEAGHAGQYNIDNKTSLSAEVDADQSGIKYFSLAHDLPRIVVPVPELVTGLVSMR